MIVGNDVEIRDLRVDEADVAARFFDTQWRRNHIFHRRRDLLLWQYHDNPFAREFSDGMTFRAAFDGDRLVGTYGYMPFVFNRYGTRQFGCYLSGYWVDEVYRRGPLPLRLLFSLQRQSPFSACIGGLNTEVAERLYQAMSWVVLTNTPRLVRILDPVRLSMMLDGTATVPSSSETGKGTSARLATEVVPLDSFDQLLALGWDEFYWKRIAPSFLGPAREIKYMQWRYAAIPIFRYEVLVAKQAGEVRGILVFRVEKIRDSELEVIRLVDLSADRSAFPALLSSLEDRGREQGAVFIDYFCTHPSYLAAVQECGYVDAAAPDGSRYWCPHLFQPLDLARMKLNCSWWIRDFDLRSPAARNDFVLMKGDYEFDRPN